METKQRASIASQPWPTRGHQKSPNPARHLEVAPDRQPALPCSSQISRAPLPSRPQGLNSCTRLFRRLCAVLRLLRNSSPRRCTNMYCVWPSCALPDCQLTHPTPDIRPMTASSPLPCWPAIDQPRRELPSRARVCAGVARPGLSGRDSVGKARLPTWP